MSGHSAEFCLLFLIHLLELPIEFAFQKGACQEVTDSNSDAGADCGCCEQGSDETQREPNLCSAHRLGDIAAYEENEGKEGETDEEDNEVTPSWSFVRLCRFVPRQTSWRSIVRCQEEHDETPGGRLREASAARVIYLFGLWTRNHCRPAAFREGARQPGDPRIFDLRPPYMSFDRSHGCRCLRFAWLALKWSAYHP